MTTPPKKRGRPAKSFGEVKRKYPKTAITSGKEEITPNEFTQRLSDAHKYKITLKLGDKVLEGSGASMLEALQSLQKPVKIVSRGVLIVSKGERQNQQLLQIPRVRRLFYPLSQTVLAKQLGFGLS